MSKKSFDPRCFELAELFLSDVPPEAKKAESATELAQLIQDTIEMYIGVELEVMSDERRSATNQLARGG